MLALEGKKIKEVACGFYHTVAASSRGALYTWGLGCYAQLGLGHLENQQLPQLVKSLQEPVLSSD